MGIAVVIIFLMQQCVAKAELVKHCFVGVALAVLFERGFPEHRRRHLLFDRQIVGVRKFAIGADGRVDRQTDAHAEAVVFHTVTGSNVNEARAGVAGDKVGGKQFAGAIAKRMMVFQLREFVRRDRLLSNAGPSGFFSDRWKQAAEQNEILTPNCRLDVLQLRVVGGREVRRQRPWCRRPDKDEGIRTPDDWKFDVDALAEVIGVFHFGLGQSRAANRTPINGLLGAINKPLFDDVREQAKLIGFVFLVQREIGIFPIAQDTEALELCALDVDVFARVGIAGFADGSGIRRRVARLAQILHHLKFDRQAVAIPAGNVRRTESTQRFRLDDDVFQNFVNGVADMNIAVGERRAVVQDEFRFAFARGLDGLIKINRLPFLETLRFAGHQIGFHGKVRLRQIQCILVVHRTF